MNIKSIQPFWYVVKFENVLRNTTINENSETLQLQSDADFEVQYLMGTANLTATTISANNYEDILVGQRYPGVLVQVTNTNSGEKWSNQPISISAMFGCAEQPLILPQTRLLARNTVLLFEIANTNATYDFNNIYLVLFGRKLYT